jgi:quinol monooxygenase YgiN
MFAPEFRVFGSWRGAHVRRRTLSLLLMIFCDTFAQSGESSDKIVVLTYVAVMKSAVGRTEQLLRTYSNASRMESGAQAIIVCKELGQPGEFLVTEDWKNRSTLDLHRRAPAMIELTTSLSGSLVSPEDVRLNTLERIPGKLFNPTSTILQATHVDFQPPFLKDQDAIWLPYLDSTASERGVISVALFRPDPLRDNHFTVGIEWGDARSLNLYRNPMHTRDYCAALVSRLSGLYDERCYRGGFGFSDRGVSGVLPGQYSNRRADIHEKAKT